MQYNEYIAMAQKPVIWCVSIPIMNEEWVS
mgnify:FL=1